MLKSHFIKFYSHGHAESSHLNSCKVDSIRAGRALGWAWNAHSLGPSTAQLSHSTDSPKVLATPAPQDKQVQECLPATFLEFYHQHWRLLWTEGRAAHKKNWTYSCLSERAGSKDRHEDNNNKLEFGDCCQTGTSKVHSQHEGGGRWEMGAAWGRCSGIFFACPGLWGLCVAFFSPHNMARWRLLAHLRDEWGLWEAKSLDETMLMIHEASSCDASLVPTWEGRPPEGGGTTREEGISREEGTKRTRFRG